MAALVILGNSSILNTASEWGKLPGTAHTREEVHTEGTLHGLLVHEKLLCRGLSSLSPQGGVSPSGTPATATGTAGYYCKETFLTLLSHGPQECVKIDFNLKSDGISM